MEGAWHVCGKRRCCCTATAWACCCCCLNGTGVELPEDCLLSSGGAAGEGLCCGPPRWVRISFQGGVVSEPPAAKRPTAHSLLLAVSAVTTVLPSYNHAIIPLAGRFDELLGGATSEWALQTAEEEWQ